jgi:hypothetical protein
MARPEDPKRDLIGRLLRLGEPQVRPLCVRVLGVQHAGERVRRLQLPLVLLLLLLQAGR